VKGVAGFFNGGGRVCRAFQFEGDLVVRLDRFARVVDQLRIAEPLGADVHGYGRVGEVLGGPDALLGGDDAEDMFVDRGG